MKNTILLNEPSVTSSDSDWIQWHKDLKSYFGKKTANSLFMAYWQKRSGTTYKSNTTELRRYAASQGMKVEGQILSGIIDSSYDFVDGIGDILKVGKTATIVIVVILVGGLGMAIFNIAKEPFKAMSAARGKM